MRRHLFQIAFLFLFLSFFSVVFSKGQPHLPTISESRELPQQIELTYALAEPIKSLDPAEANNLAEAKVMFNIFEGLVRYKANSTQIEPCLAESWVIAPDGRSWTFSLRQGVTFHDRTPFNAEAVKFSVERQLPPQKRDNMTYGGFTFGMVESVEVIAEYKVKFNLRVPYSPFLRNLAMPWAAPIVSPSALKKYGDEFAKQPVGTGPFRLAGWQKGQPVLQANDQYWGKKPQLNSIAFNYLPGDQRLAAFNAGTLGVADLVGKQSGLPAKEKAVIINQPAASLSYLGLFNNRPPFNNDKVRRAVCVALDRQEISEQLYGNASLVANSILPPKLLGYNKDLKAYSGGPEKAKELLKTYGYPNGLEIKLITYNCTRPYNPLGGEVLAENIKKQLAKAGIRVTVQAYAWHEFKTALRQQQGDAFLYGWVGDNMDPDNFLYTLLASEEVTGTNLCQYKNSEVDRLISAAQKEVDEKTRERLYFHAQQILLQDTPMVFLNYGQDSLAVASQVKGVQLNPYGLPIFANAYISR